MTAPQFWCEHKGGLGPPFPFCEICARATQWPNGFSEWAERQKLDGERLTVALAAWYVAGNLYRQAAVTRAAEVARSYGVAVSSAHITQVLNGAPIRASHREVFEVVEAMFKQCAVEIEAIKEGN